MATLKQRLHRKNSSGTYDTIHLETSADLIVGTLGIAHGGTGAVDAATARTNLGAAASSHTHDDRYFTESEMNTKLNAKANSSHTHSANNITSGTLPAERGGTGQTTLGPAVETPGVRHIYAGTADITAGSTALTTGKIYLVYQ